MDTRWIDRATLHAEIADAPARFTPWLRIYLADHAAAIFPDPR
jgi:isopentenyl-diphosphate delta-isomerase